MKAFLDYLNEEDNLRKHNGPLHSPNPRVRNEAIGKLRIEMKNRIPASDAERLIKTYSDHPDFAKPLRHANENYPEASVNSMVRGIMKNKMKIRV